MILAHSVNVIDDKGRHHQVSLDDLAREILSRIDGIRTTTVVVEAEPVDPPRVPARQVETVADRSQTVPDLDALRDALINDMAEAARSRPNDVVRSLAQIAADATAATTIAELEECRRRAVACLGD